jgi:UDP-glucose 4-epimerase
LKSRVIPATRCGLVASAEKAIRELGWKPQFPKLEDIVATAWTWHQKNPTGYPD